MPRKSIPSTTLVQAVRRHFGLEQQELAAYLGISRPHVASLEAGRRVLTGPMLRRLSPLAALLPGPDDPAAPAFAGPEAPPDPAALEARRDFCRWRAANLRRRLRPLAVRAARARSWQQVLPGLLATADERTRPWLLRRQEQAALSPADVARYHLLRLQAEALEAEAAALAALLGEQDTAK